VKEGPQLVHPERQSGPTQIVPPTVAIPHTEGASVTGGFVYRGHKFPELTGQYIFGDWESRRIWAVTQTGDNPFQKREICEPTVRVVDFSEDNVGELYLLDYDSGTIHELTRTEKQSQDAPFPRKLSETGLFASTPQHQLQPGVVPFLINAPRWTDGASAERFVAIPGSAPIQLYSAPQPIPASMFSRTAVYPPDSVVAKTLSLELEPGVAASRRRIETQLLHFDGRDWRGYSYAWNDDQTDAELVDAQGASRTLSLTDPQAPGGQRQQTWRFPSRTDCLRCHNPWPEYLLAFNLPQLNRPVVDDHGTRVNQLTRLQQMGLLQNVAPGANPSQDPPRSIGPKDPEEFPRFANPYDRSEDLNQRARIYLHVNCAHCHRNGGGGSAYVHLLQDLPLSETRTLAQKPAQGNFGLPDAQIIAPADPYRSTLLFRMAKLGPGHMPHLGAQTIDPDGVQLIHDWIRQLPPRSADHATLDRLISLDESRATARERRELPFRLRQIARQIAEQAGRPAATEPDIAEAQQKLEEQVSAAKSSRLAERPKVIAELLANPTRAFLLYRALIAGDVSAGTRGEILTFSQQHPDAVTRDLFESLLPEEQRTRRLGDVVQVDELLKLKGDATRGRDLFHKSATILCRNCHRIGDLGVELGPELTRIGKKYTKAQILENILDPSRAIEPKYLTYVVETKSGKVHSGLLASRTAEEIVLRDVENKEHRIPAAEIENVTPLQKSIMPELLLKDMTPEQVADLLDYLSTLQ
jgi:putative heme-binding domain-containing protein